MPSNTTLNLYARKSLDQITKVPDDIISVYVVEQHIWSNKGNTEEREAARKNRVAERRTIEEFLIDPVRSFLTEIFRNLSAEFNPERFDQPIGQGYWIQAEFGSGKSHLLSLIGALALGGEKEWSIIKEKEERAGRGKRESLYTFYENGLKQKTQNSKGILVAVKTLVGQGDSNAGMIGSGKTLADYVLDAVGEAYFAENGRTLPLYPTEVLATRFLEQDLERYRSDLEKYLRDPRIFDEEERESLSEFIDDLQDRTNPMVQQDRGRKLWDFYVKYLKVTPTIPLDSEPKLDYMMESILNEGYAGLLLILDEVSLYMKGRDEAQKAEDEKVLVVLSNRLAKVNNRPIWTVCSAQQAIEGQGGVRNIIADDRLKLIALLNKESSYYDIALSRVREITEPAAIDQYYEDYKRSFSWPQSEGKDKFAQFFPYYPPSIDIVRAVSYKLTTIRSALSFMLETLKGLRKQKSTDLITHWNLFDDVVNYTEDPSGTNRSITAIRTKFVDEWKSYEESIRQVNSSTHPMIKAYRSRCEKILKTLFLYYIANIAPDGLSSEELMNAVMEWKDHDTNREADLRDNKDHYENLVELLDLELTQVEKVGNKYRFNPKGRVDVQNIFQVSRSQAEHSKVSEEAWRRLLAMDGWSVEGNFMRMDLARGIRSLFRDVAPDGSQDITITWHNRKITGRVYMRDLLDAAHQSRMLPPINSPETGLDFAVFISNKPSMSELQQLVNSQKDPRVIYWSPDALTSQEQSLLRDFAAYGLMVADHANRESLDAKTVMDWVKGRVGNEIGSIYRIVTDSYHRGRMSAIEHSELPFEVTGELPAILTPVVSQVLDAVYESASLNFTFNVPFDDLNAMNVINGIVRMGEFPRGIKPGKEVSASQNYGFDLKIMVRPNDKKLDLRYCRYTRDMLSWIEQKTGGGSYTIAADTLYKNFMGTNGPNNTHYGLSKRMVQLYLLCLVREGRIRISLSGRNQPVEALDYTNIADVDFKVSTLDGFDQVQLLKAPEGWDVLAPFAAVLLENEALANVHEDADIQQAILSLNDWQKQAKEKFLEVNRGITNSLEEFQLVNPHSQLQQEWQKFVDARIDPADPIVSWRQALEKAFGYPIYQQDEVRPSDLDDLRSRVRQVRQWEVFYAHRVEFRAGMRYLQLELPQRQPLIEISNTLNTCRSRQDHLAEWMLDEALFMSEFLEPMANASESYRVRYLQLFDQVVARSEETRRSIKELENSADFQALSLLSSLTALGEGSHLVIKKLFSESLGDPGLFPANLTRAVVERDLADSPRPAVCPLTLENDQEWLGRAGQLFMTCQKALSAALREKVRLLRSAALQEKLKQGGQDPFIAGILSQNSDEGLKDYLVERLNQPEASEYLKSLEKYLKKINVIKVRMNDFRPSKRTLEKNDIAQIALEFEDFLKGFLVENHLDEQITILEIE